MNVQKNIVLCFIVFVCAISLVGCGKKADESKPIDEVKAEAEKMNV